MHRTYSELRRLETFRDRFRYLSLRGQVGASTFGYDRWMNQEFYRSREWRHARRDVLVRDLGCDLGIEGMEVNFHPIIHHMNPMDVSDITHGEDHIFDPEFLITTCLTTHNAIHYGDEKLLPRPLVPRRHGDTKLW